MSRNKRIGVWLSLAALLLSVWFIVSTLYGYGYLKLNLPAGSSVTINGHHISNTGAALKLRPGSYNISIVSARYFSVYQKVHVPLLRSTEFTPKLQKRSPESIAYTANGVSAAGTPPVAHIQWFGDEWVVEEVGFSTPSVLVAHFEQDRWNKEYITGDALNTTKIPTDIVQYVHVREEAISATNH